MVEDFFVANMTGEKVYIGDMLSDQGMATYERWKSHQESLTYRFKQDLSVIANATSDFAKKTFMIPNGHPDLLKLYLGKKVSLETVVILNALFKFAPFWDKAMPHDFTWKQVQRLMIKYRPFLTLDKEKLFQVYNAVADAS